MNLSDLQQFANESTDERIKTLYQQMQAARGIAAKHQRKREELQRENAKLKKLLRKIPIAISKADGPNYQWVLLSNKTIDEIGEV
jgi:phosphoglycolate phosphatase-like HAD superfamily hydrolase